MRFKLDTIIGRIKAIQWLIRQVSWLRNNGGGGGGSYTPGTGIDITNDVITNTAPNVTQTLSITGNSITLSNGGGTIETPNTTYSAGTGLSLTGTTFGQAITTSGTGSFVTGVTQTADGFQVNLGTPPNTTPNDGTLTLATGTGLSGSTTFSANQSTNSTFTVGIDSGYALPTTAQTTSWNNKQDTITGGATTIVSSDLTVNRALISDASGKVAVSPTTSTELGYLSGVTSSIQTQLNDKDSIKDSNETTGVGNIKFWTGTQEEYDLIPTPNSDTIYYIKED